MPQGLTDRDAERVAALPLWGEAPLPPDRYRADDADGRGFTDVVRILLRTWPWLKPMVVGTWRERALPISTNGGRDSDWSFAYAGVVVTLLALAGPFAGWLPVGVNWQYDLLLSGVLAMAVSSWIAIGARWQTQSRLLAVAVAVLVAVGLLVNLFAVLAVEGTPDSVAVALVTVAALGMWLVHFRRAHGVFRVRVRVGCHLVYYYALYWLTTLTGLVTGLFTVDLLNQSILQAEPLTPFLADFIGREDLGSGATEALTLAERRELQWIYMAFVVAIGTLTFPLAYGLPYYNVWILQRINQDLRLALVERWHQLSLRYHGDHRVGDSVYRIYQDSAQVTAIVGMLVSVATQATTYATTITFIAALDPILGLMGVTIAGIAILWGRWFSRRVRSRSLTARETNSDLTSRAQEVLGAMRVIKACSAENAERRRFESDSVVAFNAAYRVRSLVAGVSIIMFTLAGTILLAGEFLMAVWAAENREAFAAVLIGLVGLSFVRWNLGAFQWARDELIGGSNVVGGVLRQWTNAQDMAMGLDRVFEILDIEPDVVNAPDAVPLQDVTDEIRFDNVAFAYQADRPVLRGASFTARAGEITAIVGPTGSGKSTLMALLTRLFDPDNGRIAIDGVDLRRIEVESLRRNVAIALQENVLFAMSVRDNLGYAAPDASDDQIRQAAYVSCVDDYVASLPDGLDTELGDRGGKLSTGQRQRLSIARAIAKDAQILILDEPTAALDAATEHRVLQRLDNWARGTDGQRRRAIFLITHRISTIRQAHRILYLERGRIEEQGSHDELMRIPNGRYRRFVETEAALSEKIVTG
ncbi:MAG: ABC transporter ATP-binding protein [Gammaproteobacteria bacterium]|nr:ABC transporter ATP-binding protein [Gammaproteobacteria bacterium]MYK46144.1 ABC transporter ATP-binding protein [Gammaproteobacteria bacterium]